LFQYCVTDHHKHSRAYWIEQVYLNINRCRDRIGTLNDAFLATQITAERKHLILNSEQSRKGSKLKMKNKRFKR